MNKRLLIHAILWLLVLMGVIGTVLAEAGTARPQPQAGFTFPFRQGGSAVNWGSDGATNYPVTDAVLQVGSLHIPAQQGYVIVTFPQPYQYAPLVTATGVGSVVKVTTVSTNGFLVEIGGEVSSSDVVFNWMAIGE